MNTETSSKPSVLQDEEIIFFPTSASIMETEKTWLIPIHGWIFKSMDKSGWKRELMEEIFSNLDFLYPDRDASALINRLGLFLVDNVESKKIRVLINGREHITPFSIANGHFNGQILIKTEKLAPVPEWINYEAVLKKQDLRHYKGMVQLIRPEGISVITDVDDTIKVSQVTDKKELIANTFLREFRPVEGMNSVFNNWRGKGYVFHYVSASPWQLYPFLEEFREKNGFPQGSFHLKYFRLKDETFFNLFMSAETYKSEIIPSILKEYPKRKFILVGDSGEKDPEVYAQLLKEYPGQVKHVFIRQISPDQNETERLVQIFNDANKNSWTLFQHPEELLEWHGASLSHD
ncbi:MAG: App1 family protein [Candidatus Aureabacteria bacterium]|nr:App1 family protein [Candidatus Auribacterota bacterium]